MDALRIALWVLVGLVALFFLAIFFVATVRVIINGPQRGLNEKISTGEKVLAVKKTNGKKEVIE